MATSFARAEARLGKSLRARLGNAQIIIAGAAPVSGIFDDRVSDSGLGQGVGMQAREFQMVCASAEVGAAAVGVPVVVLRPAGTMNLAISEITPDPTLGNTILGLQKR